MSRSVLFVCTGNICRSPMAERLLLARVRPGDVEVSSAGTYGLTGHAMDKAAALVTRELGGDPDGHVARELDSLQVVRAGLVLTATTEHRDFVLRQNPRAMRRTFTLREFARLAAGLAPPASDDLDARVAEVAAQRGQVAAPGPGEDDIGDPYGGPIDGMRAAGAVIAAATDDVVRVLGLPRSG